MKKVLFLIRSLEGGGAEKVLIDYLNGLVKDCCNNKMDITVLAEYNAGIYINELPNEINYQYIVKKPTLNKRRVVDRFFKVIPSFILRKLYINDNYDIEISFMEGNQGKLIACAPDSVKKILWIHTDISKLEKTDFLNLKSEKRCYRSFDQVICVSNIVNKNFVKKIDYHGNITTIYNPIDKEKLIKYKHSYFICEKNEEQPIYICSVGRLVKDKRFDRLIKAIAYLKQKGYKVVLSIFGEGNERQALEKLINDLNLNDIVHLMGFKKNVYQLISKYDLFVCSSENEGFSLAVVEAMILGLPIIATKGTGAAEIIGNGEYGYLAENSTVGIVNSVYAFISNKQFIKYHKLSEIRGESFDMRNALTKLEEILK